MNNSSNSSQSQPQDSIESEYLLTIDAADRLVGEIDRIEPEVPPTENVAEINWSLSEVWEELQTTEEDLRQQNLLLEEERLKYQDLFNFAPDGYLVTTPLGVIESANQKIGQQLGMAPHLLVGIPLVVFIAPANCSLFYDYLNRQWEPNQSQTGEITIKPRHDLAFPAEFTIAPNYDRSNTLTGLRWLIRDITDRKQAQTLRQASERRYVSLAETVPVGIFRTDVTGNAIYVNNRWCEIAGLAPEIAIGNGWISALHPADRKKVAAAWYRSAQNNSQFQMEYRFLRSDGNVTWVYGQAETERDADGKIIGYAGTLTDITELKQAKIQLRLQNTLLAKVANNEPLIDILNGTIAAVEKILNGAICSVLLLGADNRLRCGAAPNLPPDYNQIVEETEIGEGVGSCGTAAFRNETIIVADIATDPLWQDYKDFALRYGLQACWSSPINSTEDWVLGTLAVYYNQPRSPQLQEIKSIEQIAKIIGIAIEREQSQAALRESQARWQFALEGAGDGVWDWHIQTDVAFFSQQWKAMLGYDDHEIKDLASEWEQRIHPDDRDRCFAELGRYLQGQIPIYEVEHRLRCKDDSYKWILARGKAIERSADGQPLRMIGTQSDIDDRKQAEQQLQTLIEGTAATTGGNYFPALVSHIAKALNVPYAAVTEKVDDQLNVLAFWANNSLQSSFAYPIADTPCQQTLQQGQYYCESLVQEQFPSDLDLVEMGAESYLGIALQDAQGNAIGNLCILDQSPINNPQKAENLLRVFAARAGAELERERAEQALARLNQELEQRVLERTAELQKSEQRLSESEAKFRRLVEGGKDFFWSVDRDGLFTYLSPQFKYMLGWETDEWIGKSFFDLVHPDDRVLINADHKNIQSGKNHHPEFRHLHRDGHYIWARVSATHTIDSAGELVGTQGILVDVTERKQAELALELEVLRRNAIFNASSDGIHIIDREGNLIEANDRFSQMLGYTPAEIVGFTVFDWDAQCFLEEQCKVLQDNSLDGITFETLHRRKDGSIFPVEISRRVMVWQGASMLVCISRDISDRQQAAAALQASEAELRSLFIGMDDIVFVVDRVGTYLKIVSTNPEKLMVPADSLLGKNIQDFFSPEQSAQFLWTIDRTLTTKQTQSYEYRLTIDYIEYWFNAKCSPLDDRSVIWVARDISEAKHEEVIRRQAEDLICQQAERAILLKEITQRIRQSLDLQTIFDTACQEIRDILEVDRVGIFKFDPESHFDDGEFVAESVGAEFPSAIAIRVKDRCFGENYAALYAKGRSYVVNDIYQNGDSVCHTNILAQFQVRANMVVPLLCGDDLWGLLCIHQCAVPRNWQPSEIDLTQQLANQLTIAIQQANLFEQVQQELSQKQQAEVKLTETNHQLAISNQELIRATRLKDEFLANMSHELRTPLNAILGLSESCLAEVFGAINERQKKAISTVERSGQHLLSLINDILEVSKIEAGKLELEMTIVSATTLTNSTLAFVKQLAHQKQIQLTTSFASNLGNIEVDERRIRQVLINLLNNAVKFTPAGGQVKLEVQLEQAEFCPLPTSTDLREQLDCVAWILFAVTDTGIGITPENQSKLFKPFVQIDGSLNRQYQGTGLGLTLVKQIVELHGGSVTLTSELGQGSCFTVRLPYYAAAAQQIIPSSEPTPSLSITDGYLTSIEYPLILLAEDNQENIDTLCSYLEACNYRLIFANNGYDAISLLESCLNTPADLPDLILMDIQMPGMDGLETMQRIRQYPQLANLPIIALTALAMAGDREKCLAAGANDYLTKPIKLKQLRENIQRLMPVKSHLTPV
jgi:PAS domain S-box-containing protein